MKNKILVMIAARLVIVAAPLLNYLMISIIWIPKNTVGLFCSTITGKSIALPQGLYFRSFFKIKYQPWYNRCQEKRTNMVDIRSYADPITNYEILTESQLILSITGKAIMKIHDPIKAYSSTNDLDATIDSLCKAELRNHFSQLTAKDIIQTQDVIEQKLTAALNRDLKDYGTLVEKFIISHILLPVALTKAVELTTAQQAEHKCKLLEIQNHKKVEEEKIKLQNLKNEAEIAYQEKIIALDKMKQDTINNSKIQFLDELKKRNVNLTEYLKYDELKKTKATLIAGLETANINYHLSTPTTYAKETHPNLEESQAQ